MAGRSQFIDDVFSSNDRIIVLPYAEISPSGFLQTSIRIRVPCPITRDLLGPIPAISPVFPTTVILATMPEAAIDEDGNLRLGEDDVGLSS